LSIGPGKNIKPEVVLGLMAQCPAVPHRIVRKELLWLDSNGSLEIF